MVRLSLVLLLQGCIGGPGYFDGFNVAEQANGVRQCTTPILVMPDTSLTPADVDVLTMATQYWNSVGPTKLFFQVGQEDVQAEFPEGLQGGFVPVFVVSQEIIKKVSGVENAIGVTLFKSKTGNCLGPTLVLLDRESMNGDVAYALTLIVHELGHVLALPHNSLDEASVMYPNLYSPTGEYPKIAGTVDLAILRALYGAEVK